MPQATPFPSIASIGRDIGALICRHIDECFREILRGPGVTVTPRYLSLLTNEPHPFGNFTVLADPADLASTDEAIAPLLGCPAPTAVMSTGTIPRAVAEKLAAAGFHPHEAMPAQAVEIERMERTSLPPGYTLVRLGAGAEGETWANTFSDGYELPRRVGARFGPSVIGATKAPDARFQYFGVSKNGAIVSTSFLYLNHGVAGIYGVATLPSERGKGLGAHAASEPLRLAHALGYRVGILQASPAGYPIYKRLGFRDFGEVPLWVRMPS